MGPRLSELSEWRSFIPTNNIYAYCHVRTNQVLYSMTQYLNNRALKQLPDIGANHTPPKLRKDSWRPLWTISLPDTEDGKRQTLDAFRKLREWRKLHELNWEPTDRMSRPYNEEELKELEEQLERRGGSKKESVYDLVKRMKWNMRAHIIMDQKANSVADLAAVLMDHHRKEFEYSKDKIAEGHSPQVESVNTATKAAHFKSKAMEELLGPMAERQRTLAAFPDHIKQLRGEGEHQDQRDEKESEERKKLLNELKQEKGKVLLEEMEKFASAALKNAKSWANLTKERREKELEYWNGFNLDAEIRSLLDQYYLLSQKADKPPGYGKERARLRQQFILVRKALRNLESLPTAEMSEDQIAIAMRASSLKAKIEPFTKADEQIGAGGDPEQFVPPFPTRFYPALQRKVLQTISRLQKRAALKENARQREIARPNEDARLEKLARLHEAALAKRNTKSAKAYEVLIQKARKARRRKDTQATARPDVKPTFTTKGVVVRWANVLDAEYGESWPAEVVHLRMSPTGHSKHTAKRTKDSKSALEVAEKWSG